MQFCFLALILAVNVDAKNVFAAKELDEKLATLHPTLSGASLRAKPVSSTSPRPALVHKEDSSSNDPDCPDDEPEEEAPCSQEHLSCDYHWECHPCAGRLPGASFECYNGMWELGPQPDERPCPACYDDNCYTAPDSVPSSWNCDSWVGYDCSRAVEDYGPNSNYPYPQGMSGYSQEDEDELLAKCALTCNQCSPTPNCRRWQTFDPASGQCVDRPDALR
jgi:hypothetical protein